MKRITIFRNGVQTHGAEVADPTAWIAEHAPTGMFGKSERWVRVTEEDVSQALETREVQEFGETITEYKLSAEFTIELVDLSAEIAARSARISALRALVIEVRDFDIAGATTAQLKVYLGKQRQLQLRMIQLMKSMMEDSE